MLNGKVKPKYHSKRRYSCAAVPPRPFLRRTLQKLLNDAPLVYVDCGARGGRIPDWLRALKDTKYVGFEADAEECARLNASARRGHRYIEAYLAGSRSHRTFYLTRSAACASLLQPNIAFLEHFTCLAPLFHVEQELNVLTATLTDSLAAAGVDSPDFIELDTQGNELEILSGAERLIASSVLGLQVEVEFGQMYIDQALFADVDRYLCNRGFYLLDLSRHRVRRAAAPATIPTRGQILWGHALYLRDLRELEPGTAARLAVIAAMLDRPDIAAAALQQVVASARDKELRKRAAAALSAVTGKSRGLSRRLLFNRWRRRGADPQLRASVNQTTWRD
jgi:FkbM family methyltransferase